MGLLLKWLINVWLASTGKRCRFADYPWLQGPMGDTLLIGDEYYKAYAAATCLDIAQDPAGGLVADFRALIQADDPLRARLLPAVAHFYEHTAQYKLEVWSQWYGPYAIFARTLIRSLSAKMNQLNIPLRPPETSRGMSNEVLHLKDRMSGELVHACWLRKSILTGRVVYSGFYSGIQVGGRPMVRVVFPLPGGNATVLLRVEVQEDGSVKLLSDGKRIGDAGYYRVRRLKDSAVRVKYVPLKEVIHVFRDSLGDLRTDHIFTFLGLKMLHLHYKIMKA
jgi:hypothetical protein